MVLNIGDSVPYNLHEINDAHGTLLSYIKILFTTVRGFGLYRVVLFLYVSARTPIAFDRWGLGTLETPAQLPYKSKISVQQCPDL